MKMNLLPGQFQIGDGTVFGRGTNLRVLNVQPQSYQVAPQDVMAIRSDKITFGQDSFAPAPVIFEILALQNFEIDNIAPLAKGDGYDVSSFSRLTAKMAQEWRGDAVRSTWNNQSYIRHCAADGITRLWFGRPRKFEHVWKTRRSTSIIINAEFMRSNTLQWSDDEYGIPIPHNETVSVSRLDGESTACVRFIIEGPANNPTILFGDVQIKLLHNIASGKLVEISSYPWQERVIDSDGHNLIRMLQGQARYLDKIQWPAGSTWPLKWSAENTNANSKMTLAWREAYPVMI